MQNDKKGAFYFLVFLFLTIVLLPFAFKYSNAVIRLFEQPIFILMPNLIISFIYLKKTQNTVREFFFIRKIRLEELGLLILIALLTPFLTYYIGDVFKFLSGELGQDPGYLTPRESSSTWAFLGIFLYNIVYSSVFPAFCEETLFRGSLMSLSKKIGLKTLPLIILNALLFAIFHTNLAQLFYTFALGIVLASSLITTGSILSPIIIHALFNFWADIPSLLDLDKHKIIGSYFYAISIGNNLFFAIAASVAIFFILRYLYKKQKCHL